MVLKTCSQVSKMARRGVPVTDDLIRKMVIEGFQPDAERLWCEGTWKEFPEERILQLKFLDNKVADTVTGKELKGSKEECLKLALLDLNGHTVTHGPGSSAKVEILLLEDNCDSNEHNMTLEKFERSIIQTGDKKRPHFSRKSVHIFLKEGVADLKGIKLGHDKDWIKMCSCRLGARIGQNLEGTMVHEAWTAPFEIRDKRHIQYEKDPYPYLTSEVWRLTGIGRTGKRRDRLREKYIETVQDFLFWHHVNPEELQNTILDVGDGIWKTIVSHAQDCKIDCAKMFCHKSSSEPQRCVIYDCVGKLKGEMIESQFVGIDNLSADKKDDALKLLRSVLQRASALYDDENEFTYPITSTIGGHGPLGSKERGEVSKPDAQLTPLHTSDNEKHANPSLCDEVWRLDCIWRRGEIDMRLQDNNICTVEDFLIQHLINPQRLKSIVNSPNENWQKIVSNARACLSSERLYCYIDPEKKTGIVFNILGHMLRLLPDQTSAQEEADADKLLASACQNWGQVKAFDDQNSLQQHLAGLIPYIGGSSSSIHLDTSCHSFDPVMSFLGEAFFAGADEFMRDTFGYEHGLMNGWNAASEVVDGERKGWKILLIVLKFRKRVVLDVSPIRKKSRVG
ncbi:calmodulin-binding protein 60 A-like isoform X1 [Salvia splendens]|uniref:calmodulin-binding protein 60 A-like isoform X1 n=1 Tax=Salvia splendens TaxID=180675 RepID=UPI001C272493|nr:calmodulin-binding protein 60 A-like isoform X1 [Salvia splendens]